MWEAQDSSSYQAAYPLVRKAKGSIRTFGWVHSNRGVLPLDRKLLRELGVKAFLISGLMSKFEVAGTGERVWSYDRDTDRDRDNRVSISMVIEDGWNAAGAALSDAVLPDGVLALPLSKQSLGGEARDSHMSNEERNDYTVKILVHHFASMRESAEFSVKGALLLKHGTDNLIEEIRAGEHIDALAKLADVLGAAPKKTKYFAWGDEAASAAGVVSKFVAELSIGAREGDGFLAEIWQSVLGGLEIPFEKKERMEMIKRASLVKEVEHRVSKWAASLGASRRSGTIRVQ